MKRRPLTIIWIGLICLSVLGYLLALGQVNIRQFEANLTHQSRQNLLQLAGAQQRHGSDLLGLFSRQIRYVADRINYSTGLTDDFLDEAVVSFDYIDAQGQIVSRFLDKPQTPTPNYSQLLEAYWHGSPALDRVSVLIEESAQLPAFAIIHPLSTGTTFSGMLVMRIPVGQFLARLERNGVKDDIATCLLDGSGRIYAATMIAGLSNEIAHHTATAGPVFRDIRNRQSGVGFVVGGDGDSTRFLAGHWPLVNMDAPWSVAVIQSDRAIRTAVTEHARNIQLGMVCLFLATFLIWLLYYRSAQRTILLEQQRELGVATEELHHLSTQSRQTQTQLARQITLYRGILNAIPMGLCWKDRQGRLVGYNPEYAHIAGLKRMEDGLEAGQSAEPLPQDGLPLDMEVMNKDIELLFLPQTLGQGGAKHDYLVSKIAVKDPSGRVCGLLGGFLNQALLKSVQEQSFCAHLGDQCVIDHILTPAAAVDCHGRMLCANGAFQERFGLSGQSLFGRSLKELVLPEPSEPLDRILCGQAVGTEDIDVRWRDCSFKVLARPFPDGGQRKGVVLVWFDVSAMRKNEAYLEHALYCHHRAIKALRSDTKTDNHTHLLTTETLDSMDAPNSLVCTRELIDAVQRNFLEKYGDTSPFWETAVEPHSPELFEGDRHKLYQSLTILTELAAEYAAQKQVAVCVRSDDSDDDVATLHFTVEHPGRPPLGDALEKIINPDVSLMEWYRECDGRDQAIGLRIVARLLAKINTRLTIDEQSGRTRYCFKLPACVVYRPDKTENPETSSNQETMQMHEHNNPAQQAENTMSASILVVDDVQENRALLDILLTKLGYRPVQCSGGKQAVQMCRDQRYDLVLMDIQMPDMNGFEAVRQIRDDSLNPAVPIIAMTASDARDDELTALECGCDSCLFKPINRKLLEQKVWRSLAKLRQMHQAEQGLEIVSFLEGDPDYYKTIEMFVNNLPGRIEEIRQAFEKQDYKDLAFKVHALKGLGGFAGFSVYTDKAADIEGLLRQQDLDTLQSRIDEMMQMCMRTKISQKKS